MIYNWQQPNWPEFRYDISEVDNMLFNFPKQTGHVSSILKAMPEDGQLGAVKTSEIEVRDIYLISKLKFPIGHACYQSSLKY